MMPKATLRNDSMNSTKNSYIDHNAAAPVQAKNVVTLKRSIYPMLVAKPTFANNITALETGYLVQDTICYFTSAGKDSIYI